MVVAFVVEQIPLDDPPTKALNAVTLVSVIALPLAAGAVQLTITLPLPAV